MGMPFYVGKGCNGRDLEHGRSARRGNHGRLFDRIRSIWRRGHSYTINRIFTTESELKAYEIEKLLISILLEFDLPLENIHPGGGNLRPDCHTEISRARISKVVADGWKNPIVRARRIAGLRKSHSRPEVREKFSRLHKRTWANNLTRKKQAAETMRQNWRSGKIVHRCWNRGKRMNDAYRKRIGDQLRREHAQGLPGHRSVAVKCKETGQKFPSLLWAGKSVNRTFKNIYQAIHTGRRSGGLHWAYVNKAVSHS